MSRLIRNWVVRPVAWAFPMAVIAWLLDVHLTWRVILLVILGSTIDSTVDYLIPHLT